MEMRDRKRRISPQEKETLAADLRWRFSRDCQAAGLRPGDMLPSEKELAALHGVGLALVRGLYRQLREEGAVESIPCKGVQLRRGMDSGGRPRALSVGVVAFLELKHPAHRFNLENFVLNAVDRKSAARGGGSRFFNLFPEHTVTPAMLEALKAARPDGLIFISADTAHAEDDIRELLTLDIPLVVPGHRTELTHCVLFDHRQAASDITKHLLSRGLGKIAFLQQRSGDSWAKERLQGFNDAGGGLFIELDNTHRGAGSEAELRDTLQKLLAEGVQGVLCSGDPYAVILLELAKSQGLRIPEDLAIAGMDDNVRCRPFNLTTVQCSRSELSDGAFELLMEVIAAPPPNPVERRVHCPLLIRDTAPTPITKPRVPGGGR